LELVAQLCERPVKYGALPAACSVASVVFSIMMMTTFEN
jgi:hypothetical protein